MKITQAAKPGEQTARRGQQSRPIGCGTTTLIGVHLLMSLLWILWRIQDATVSRENGPMENFQAICLFLGFCVLGVSALKSLDSAARVFKAGLALFYGTFLLLEVDLRDLDFPLLVRMTNGPVRDALLGLIWAFGVWQFIRSRNSVLLIFRSWISSYSGILLSTSGVFWLASALVDKSILIKKDLFIEEILEVNATMLMLLAAILIPRIQPKYRAIEVSQGPL